jgi:hypothetical protein
MIDLLVDLRHDRVKIAPGGIGRPGVEPVARLRRIEAEGVDDLLGRDIDHVDATVGDRRNVDQLLVVRLPQACRQAAGELDTIGHLAGGFVHHDQAVRIDAHEQVGRLGGVDAACRGK